MKSKTKKLYDLEKNRISIFINDLRECYFCRKPREDLHEILYGANRRNSMKYGFVLPLCREHHRMFHDNHKLTLDWCKKCQKRFEEDHTREEWLSIFHRNYL